MFPIQLLIPEPTPTPTPDRCPTDGVRKMDGTGAHLGLRNPWYNDLSHDITDSTLFRIILIFVVLDHVIQRLR